MYFLRPMALLSKKSYCKEIIAISKGKIKRRTPWYSDIITFRNLVLFFHAKLFLSKIFLFLFLSVNKKGRGHIHTPPPPSEIRVNHPIRNNTFVHSAARSCQITFLSKKCFFPFHTFATCSDQPSYILR